MSHVNIVLCVGLRFNVSDLSVDVSTISKFLTENYTTDKSIGSSDKSIGPIICSLERNLENTNFGKLNVAEKELQVYQNTENSGMFLIYFPVDRGINEFTIGNSRLNPKRCYPGGHVEYFHGQLSSLLPNENQLKIMSEIAQKFGINNSLSWSFRTIGPHFQEKHSQSKYQRING